MSELNRYRVQIFGASVDTVEANKAFAEKNQYPFPLLSDPERELARKLGVLSPAGFANRWTYVIDARGVIRAIFERVDVRAHGKEVARKLEELGVPKK